MPGTFDLDVYAGDRTVVYLDDITDADGNLVDYSTGWVTLAEVAADREATTEEMAKFTVTAPAPGALLAVLPASESAKLRALVGQSFDPDTEVPVGQGVGVWDLQVTPADDPEGTVTILSGKVKITGDVSRA